MHACIDADTTTVLVGNSMFRPVLEWYKAATAKCHSSVFLGAAASSLWAMCRVCLVCGFSTELSTTTFYVNQHHGSPRTSLPTVNFPAHPAGFELVEEDCRRLQDPELATCKEGCNKDKKDCSDPVVYSAVVKKCKESFKEGSMLEAWCRNEFGCER